MTTMIHRLDGRKTLFAGVLLTSISAATAAWAVTATWSAVTALSNDFAFSELSSPVEVAINSSGRAVTAWDKPLPPSGLAFSGPHEVFASVRTSPTSNWSAPVRLSPVGTNSTTIGSVVDPVTGKITVAWTTATQPFVSSSTDGGLTWATTAPPVEAGYRYLPNARGVDIDSKGNITFILHRPRTAGVGIDVLAIVRSSGGTWRTPSLVSGTSGVVLTGSGANLNVLGDGRALFSFGTTTFRRSAAGTWSAGQTADTSGFQYLDKIDTDIDSNGRAYMFVRGFAGGVWSNYITTAVAGGTWVPLRRFTESDALLVGLDLAASSSGRALMVGTDNTGHLWTIATIDGGSTWTSAADLGLGVRGTAAGSENGLYLVAWNGPGAAYYSVRAASGSGVGATPWAQMSFNTTAGTDSPSIAIAAKSRSSTTARLALGWERQGDPAGNGASATTGSTGR